MKQITSKSKYVLFLIPLFMAGFLLVSLNGQIVLAQNEADTACQGIQAVGDVNCGDGEDELNNVVKSVINILLFVVGVAAVIMLVVGGIRYVASGGDQQAVATAKNTVIYSIVGLIVAFLAYAIVNYVFGVL